MQIVEWIGFGVLVVLIVLGALFLRRAAIAGGGGTIEASMRLSTLVPGRGWSAGLGRFAGDELRWYRVFSFSPRPCRVVSRRGLSIESRRRPDEVERLAIPADWIIVRCVGPATPVEIAMAATTLTGFLSWVEAAPPGPSSMRLAAQ
jgi:hypothetical protein